MKYGAPPSIWKRLPKIMNITEANSWAHGLNGGMNLLFQLYDYALDEPESRAIDQAAFNNFVLLAFEDPIDAFKHISYHQYRDRRIEIGNLSQQMMANESAKLIFTLEHAKSSKLRFIPKCVRFDICKYSSGAGLFETINQDKVSIRPVFDAPRVLENESESEGESEGGTDDEEEDFYQMYDDYFDPLPWTGLLDLSEGDEAEYDLPWDLL